MAPSISRCDTRLPGNGRGLGWCRFDYNMFVKNILIGRYEFGVSAPVAL